MPKQIEVDEEFLRKYIAEGGQAETPTGSVIASENVDDFLRQASTTPQKRKAEDEQTLRDARRGLDTGANTSTPRVRAAQPQARGAIDAAAASDRTDRTAQLKQQSTAEHQYREDNANKQAQTASKSNVLESITKVTNPIVDRGTAISDRIGSIRTVGGIGLLLVILFVLLFTVVQVGPNGTTRLKQIWYLLTFRAELQGKKMLTLPIPQKEDIGADVTQLLQATAQVGNDELAYVGIAATQAFNSVTSSATGPISDSLNFLGNLGSDIASFRIQP
jgi:hypothetical protein